MLLPVETGILLIHHRSAADHPPSPAAFGAGGTGGEMENHDTPPRLHHFSLISIMLGRSTKSSSPTLDTMPCGDDLAIPPADFSTRFQIEIHTESLAWLSCPLDTNLSQQT